MNKITILNKVDDILWRTACKIGNWSDANKFINGVVFTYKNEHILGMGVNGLYDLYKKYYQKEYLEQ